MNIQNAFIKILRSLELLQKCSCDDINYQTLEDLITDCNTEIGTITTIISESVLWIEDPLNTGEIIPGTGEDINWNLLTNIPTEFPPSAHTIISHSDVDNTNIGVGKIIKVGGDGVTHEYVDDETGTDEKVKYDAGDSTAGYVVDKIIAGDGISVAEGIGADENKLVITNTDKGSDVVVPVNADFTLAGLGEKSYSNLTDIPTTFTPSSHGNGSHSTDLVGEPGVIDAKTEKTTLVDADVAIIEDSADLEVGLKKPKKITWANIRAWLGIDNLLFTFSENDLGNSGASKTVSFGTKSFQKITVTADCILTLTAPSSGSGRFQLTAIQGGVGNFNLIFPTGAGGCVFPQGAFDFTAGTTGQVTIITLLWNGVYWVVVPTEYFNIPA